MRQIEIILGGLIVATAVAVAGGWADQVWRLPPLGMGATLAIVTSGLVLVAHGVIGLLLRRGAGNPTSLRVHGRAAFTVLLVAAIVVSVPALAAPLNLFSAGGFPGGFYFAAQGALIALAILAFRAADGLDRAEGSDLGPESGEGER